MNSPVRRRVASVFLALSAAMATSLVGTPPAQAATYGWVYISMPTWLGNCAFGSAGSVRTINASVGNTWSVAGDTGDDLVYARVLLGQNQQVSYNVFCAKWPAGSWQAGVGKIIRPTRNNQTVWVGPAGVRYN